MCGIVSYARAWPNDIWTKKGKKNMVWIPNKAPSFRAMLPSLSDNMKLLSQAEYLLGQVLHDIVLKIKSIECPLMAFVYYR